MNIIFIYDSSKSSISFVDDLKKTIPFCIENTDLSEIDMSHVDNLNECFYRIIEIDPVLIITLDGAGFEFRTEADDLSFNQLPCKMAHIFMAQKNKYVSALKDRQNFQMFTYISEDESLEKWMENYPEIPNIKKCTKFKPNGAKKTDIADRKGFTVNLINMITDDLWINRENKQHECSDI